MDSQESVIDFSKICRLCLTEDSSMSSIFKDEDSYNSVSLPVKIMACVSIEVSFLCINIQTFREMFHVSK